MGDKSSTRVTSLKWQSNVVNPSLKFVQGRFRPDFPSYENFLVAGFFKK